MSKKSKSGNMKGIQSIDFFLTCLTMADRGEKLISNQNLSAFDIFEWLFRYFYVNYSCGFIVLLKNASIINHAKFIEMLHYLSHFVFRFRHFAVMMISEGTHENCEKIVTYLSFHI